jgi:hypothetical protein
VTILFESNQAQREGVILTPSVDIPTNLPRGEIQAILDMPVAAYEDPTNRIFADLYQSDLTLPGGWRLRASNRPGGWLGGRFVDEDGIVNPPPILFALSVSDAERGKTFRIEFDVAKRMRVGLTVNLLEF